jgi:proline iminopeptidase
MKRVEGILEVPDGNIWYEIIGDKETVPLIALHGGPGYPHESLEPLEDLAEERKIIFYDQLGCGNSKKTTDKLLWTVDHFVRELQLLIKSLTFKKYHILGHSWGSALAVAFALTQPTGLQSLILTDPYLSTPQWDKDAKRMLSTMPIPMQKVLKEGNIGNKAYKEARKEYYYRHVYRFKKFPIACVKASNKMNRELYGYMWGSEEFNVSGTLKDLDLVPRLKEIKIPVFLLCGKYDEATPEALALYQFELPNSQMKVFEKSAHFPHWTERKDYIACVRNFLKTANI